MVSSTSKSLQPDWRHFGWWSCWKQCLIFLQLIFAGNLRFPVACGLGKVLKEEIKLLIRRCLLRFIKVGWSGNKLWNCTVVWEFLFIFGKKTLLNHAKKYTKIEWWSEILLNSHKPCNWKSFKQLFSISWRFLCPIKKKLQARMLNKQWLGSKTFKADNLKRSLLVKSWLQSGISYR